MNLRKIKYLCCIFIISVIVFSLNYLLVIPTTNENVLKKIIVLDAGHGGEDGGAVSKSGILEKNINLEITLKVKEILEKNGFKILLTRESDVQVYDNDDKTVHSKKVADINNRINIVNNSNADMVVCIHLNSFTEEKYSGWQTFYKNNCVLSSKVAENVQNSIKDSVKRENERAPLAIKGVKLIEKSTIPAVLVECGFLSNIKEANLLNNKEYQEKIANGIANGIIFSYE